MNRDFVTNEAFSSLAIKSQNQSDEIVVQFHIISNFNPINARSLLVSAAPTSLPFLFSFYLTLVLPSPPCPVLHLSFHLKLCGRSGRNCLLCPPVLSDYNGSPDTHFSRGMTRLMSWPDGECYLRPPQSLVVSLSSHLSYPLLSFLGLEVYCLVEVF